MGRTDTVKAIQRSKTAEEISLNVGDFNAKAIGVQDYYCIATRVNLNFSDIADGAIPKELLPDKIYDAFNAGDVSYVSTVLAAWLYCLPFYAVMFFLYNVFASIRRFLTFAIVSCVMVVVQCVLYYLLCTPQALGLTGVPIADLVYYVVCCVILIYMLWRMIGAFDLRYVLWLAVRVLIATAIATVLTYFISTLLPGYGMLGGLLRLVVAGSIGLVVAFGLCYVLRIEEMSLVTDLVGKVAGRFKRG